MGSQHRYALLAVLSLLALGGCRGDMFTEAAVSGELGPGGEGAPGTGDSVETPNEPGEMIKTPEEVPAEDGICAPEAPPIRRLNKVEYVSTMQAAFPDVELPDLLAPTDPKPHGFDNDAVELKPSALLVENHVENGRAVAEAVFEQTDVLGLCEGQQDDFSGCGQALVDHWGPKLFRRPLSEEQREAYLSFFGAPPEGASVEDAAKLTLQLMLAAPEFVYRIEKPAQAETRPGEVVRVDGYTMASRMSYFIWGSMPDDVLLEAAGNGQLDTEEGVREQAERMLKDERAKGAFMRFHQLWLEMDKLEDTNKMEEDNFTREVQNAMQKETDLFLERVIYEDGGTMSDLFSSGTTFIDENLANLYGVDAPEEAWSEVTIPGEQRAGFLTQASFLASHGHPDRPSPVLRGYFVLNRLMCMEFTVPPDAADLADAAAEGLEGPLTNREFYELTTNQGNCTGCHTLINGIGYAFENYDTMGRWRTDEVAGRTVDASGAFRDWSYDSAPELAGFIAGSENVEQCMVRQWLRYAGGGNTLLQPSCIAEEIRQAWASGEASLKDIPLHVVTHPAFALMRIPAAGDDPT